LFAGWMGLLVLDGPGFARHFQQILMQLPPGARRHAALERVAAEATGELLVLPVLLIGILGYGIAVDQNAAFGGGRWFYQGWKPLSQVRKKKERRSGRDA
jgi:hypothetical protein